MARMTCRCGADLSNQAAPNDIELVVYTDKEWAKICDCDSIQRRGWNFIQSGFGERVQSYIVHRNYLLYTCEFYVISMRRQHLFYTIKYKIYQSAIKGDGLQ